MMNYWFDYWEPHNTDSMEKLLLTTLDQRDLLIEALYQIAVYGITMEGVNCKILAMKTLYELSESKKENEHAN